jgi:hypothetical protein
MWFQRNKTHTLRWLLAALCFCAASRTAHAQVSPAEITNPHLKAAETAYYPQIMVLYRAIIAMKTPFSFQLSRYVGIDPSQQAEIDSRGVEFVYYQNRLLLKISGNYNAAYSAERLTQNQRASHTFSDVIAPILSLVTKQIPEDVACDGIGFEIAYHVRTASQNFDYEGKEILVVVLDRADAFAFVRAGSDSGRQEILNHSGIYLDGKEFGLALGQDKPFDLEAIGKTVGTRTDPAPSAAGAAADSRTSLTLVNPKLLPPRTKPTTEPGNASPVVPDALAGQRMVTTLPAAPAATADSHPMPATAADVERLQSQFQAQLDALASAGQANFHFVNYAPPSFILYRNQVLLQVTLRNRLRFSQDSGSIYKRAAQSFDLFLALQLKDLLDTAPAEAPFEGYDMTVLNQLGSEPGPSSEAIEFICPRNALRQFADADITNQQLIDESIILVNGVRIALNLQLVE